MDAIAEIAFTLKSARDSSLYSRFPFSTLVTLDFLLLVIIIQPRTLYLQIMTEPLATPPGSGGSHHNGQNKLMLKLYRM